MKATPLLELWQKPEGAGEPIGVFATTFTLEPDFFERSCLARFLAVESVDEGTGSVEDIVAGLELEESLRAPVVTVLADRTAQAERSTLRWNLLHCYVNHGLFHPKVTVLLWERATRVFVSSANLTPAGYRHNIEIAVAADLGPTCIFTVDVLSAMVDELEGYLTLVPGLEPDVPARRDAERTLKIFRERIAAQGPRRSEVAVALAPTNASTQPLDHLRAVWGSGQPLEAIHVSPFWDTHDPRVLKAVGALLTGRPTSGRRSRVAVTIGPLGQTSFPPELVTSGQVDSVVQLGPLDDNIRALHAKCLVIQNKQSIAVLVGSANHTAAGLGLGGPRRHRELSVWVGARLHSRAGEALRDLVPCGHPVDVDAPYVPPEDEDEDSALVALPPFFQLCRLSKTDDAWELRLSFDPSATPTVWQVSTPSRTRIIDRAAWEAKGRPAVFVYPIDSESLPMYLDVDWDGSSATWVVVADDRHDLPPRPELADLRSSQLLDALASGKSLAQVLREKLERDAFSAADQHGMLVDPLKRFDSRSTLLRRGRALAAALAALERRLARPVLTVDALEARLAGPLGPQFLATKVVDECENGAPRADALFTIAEIALSVGRVPWDETLRHADDSEAIALVSRTLERLDHLRSRLGEEPAELASYALRAIKEAQRCLPS